MDILTSIHGRKIGLGKDGDLIIDDGVAQHIFAAPSGRIVAVTDATLTITKDAHEGRTLRADRAAGTAFTLPAATGSGDKYRIVAGAAVTSNSSTVKVVGNDTMTGVALVAADGGNSVNGFETAADSDTITWDGSTTGGLKGDVVELEDIAADTWAVKVTGAATGTEATPFSATV